MQSFPIGAHSMQNREKQIQKHTQVARQSLRAADEFFEQGHIIQVSENLAALAGTARARIRRLADDIMRTEH